jgi:type IV pilus assembly protein PilW
LTASRSHGFGLVEVMVSVALGTFVAIAALAVHARTATEARTALALQQVHEAARTALDLLERELRAAGHLGPAPGAEAVAGTAVAGTRGADFGASQCGPAVAVDLARAVTGADGAYALERGRPLECEPAPWHRTVPGSDTLTVRRAASEPAPAERGRLQLAATRTRGALFANGSVPLLGPGTAVHDLEVGLYYVSADSSSGRGTPSLRRKRLVGGPAGPRFEDEELVVGVEDLQVEFGVDGPDPDEMPERYVTAAALDGATIPRVVRLRLAVVAETRDPTARHSNAPPTARRDPRSNDPRANRARLDDAHRRLVVERTVYLRNLRRS